MDDLITIKLFDQSYTFRAGVDTKRAQEVVEYLVSQVVKIESQQNGMSKIAILLAAALNITNDLIELRYAHSELVSGVSDQYEKLLDDLDSAVT